MHDELALRYGDNSGELAGQCVEPSGTGETGAASTSTSSSLTDSGGPPPASTSTSDSVGTTVAADGSTSRASTSDGSTGAGTGDTGGSESTGTAAGCPPVYVDEFDDDVIGMEWSPFTSPGMQLQETSGRLELTLDSSAAADSGIEYTYGALDGHRVWVHLADLLPETTMSSLDTCLYTGSNELCFWCDATTLTAARVESGVDTVHVSVTTNPALNAYVAIAFDAGTARWEVSGDGVTWQEVFAEPSIFAAGALLTLQISGGTYGVAGIPDGAMLSAEAVGICAL